MITALRLEGKQYSLNPWILLLCALYTTVLLVALRTFVLWQSINFLLGSAALMSATILKRENKGSLRFAFAALLLSCVSLMLPVKTILFFALVFAVFFMVESFYGKLNILPLIIAGMMSPIFQYMTNIFSFPIRLKLTTWAGNILTAAGSPSTVQGNMIYCKGNEFAVDPACMGLNMMITSLLLGIMIIATYQKRYSQTLNTWHIGFLLIIVSVFNVVSNLFRIVCLVQFNILPGTLMHDVVGIMCLLLYVILPSTVFIKWMVRNCGKEQTENTKPVRVFTRSGSLKGMHAMVAGAIIVSSFSIMEHDKKMDDLSRPLPIINGYKGQRISADVIKLENEKSLVYIKAIPGFYSADHNPMICWKGSGYEFLKVQEQIIGGTKVYAATLQNGHDTLYTAWWYDNGKNRTVDQLNWRWDVLKGGKNYSVVNVTSANKKLLDSEIQQIQTLNRFQLLL